MKGRHVTARLFIYPVGSTGHVAWTLNGHYVSFHPGDKLTDLGSRELPLPAGLISGRVYAHEPRYDKISEDEVRYGTSTPPLDLPNLDENAGAHLAGAFIGWKIPYILWDPAQIGAINCVTFSILLFAVMLPQTLPQAWDDKWGDIFDDIRHHGARGGDWLKHVFTAPVPELMHVAQIKEMADDWISMQGGPASSRTLPAVITPPLPKAPEASSSAAS